MDITIIIPNYNGALLLEKNLPAVMEATKNYQEGMREIIIVDDGSEDNSKKIIQNFELKFNNLKLIEHKQNQGFSSTVNTGVKNAKGKVVILLNTDVKPEKKFLKPLLSHFKDEKVFAVGCLDKSIEENGEIIERGRGLAKWHRGFLVHKRGEVNKADTFWVSAGSGAFKRSLWNRLGGMDSLYNPFYWEDIDLSYRAQKAGYKVLFEPDSIVVHDHQKGAVLSQFTPSQMKTIAYRNQFFFVWKNITDFELILSHIIWLPYHFIRRLLALDIFFCLGFIMAFIKIKSVLDQRKKINQLFIYKDKKIIFDD